MTPRPEFRRLALLACASLLLAGCRHHDDDDEGAARTPVVASMRSANLPPVPLGPGDIRIVTVDSGIDLALIGDSISTGLSPYALAKVRRETDTATVSGTGFGASIEKMVKGAVAGAIGSRVVWPLAAVRDVRYEQGRLVFEWVGKPPNVWQTSRVNGRPVLASFPPADAQRFVDAVRARKAARGR